MTCVLVAGWCLHDLGRPREAADVLDRARLSLPDTARRASARFDMRRVLAYVAIDETDHASALTDQVLNAANLVDSTTIRYDLRRLARSLVRWRTHHSVRELYPRLGASLRTPSTS